MLGSDHGAVNTPNNLNVGRELEARYGMKTSRDPPLNLWSDKLDKPIDAYGGIWTHQGVTGNCMLHLYIRDPSRPTRDAWRTLSEPHRGEGRPVWDGRRCRGERV